VEKGGRHLIGLGLALTKNNMKKVGRKNVGGTGGIIVLYGDDRRLIGGYSYGGS
jgi:hypothetical protein